MRWLLGIALALVVAPPAYALTVTATKPVDPRLTDVRFSTPSLRDGGQAYVLLPDGYADHPERRYPVLYLLHGGLGKSLDWIGRGDVEKITAGRDVIVVMPEGGIGGWYTDWWNGGRGGSPKYETFHVDELVRWVDTTYRTIPDRRARGIAGLSMGGFGAMSYAARNPAVYGWAASFSGALDITRNPATQTTITAEAAWQLGRPFGPFGDPVAQRFVWRAHDPIRLADRLRGTRVILAVGTGRPGPLDRFSLGDPVEDQMHGAGVRMHQRLDRLGIPHVWNAYGSGTHSWPYWQRDLRTWLPDFLAGAQPG